MVADPGDSDEAAEDTEQTRECMACGGSGRVVSHLGGTSKVVPCPWCEGGGVRLADVDAQAHWRKQRDADS